MDVEVSRVGVAGYDLRQLAPDTVGRLLRRLGLRLFELPYDPADPDAEKAIVTLQEHGVRVFCLGPVAPRYRLNSTGAPDTVQEAIRQAVQFASTIRAEYVNIGLGPNACRDPFTTLKWLKRKLSPCLELAETLGITIVVENHFDMRSEDPEHRDLVRRAESLAVLFETIGSPRFRYVYDPCNFYIAGEEAWPQSYRILKSFVAYIHLKDAVRYSEWLHGDRGQYRILNDTPNAPFVTVPLGEGGVNYEGLFHELEVDRYSGLFVLETYAQADAIGHVLEQSLGYLRNKLPSIASLA